MYKTLTKNGQTFAFILGAVITVIFLAMVLPKSGDLDLLDKEEQYKTGMFDFGLYGAIFLTFVAMAGMVIFGVVQVLSNLKTSMKGLIGVGILLAIFLVAYITSPEEGTGAVAGAVEKFENSQNTQLSTGNFKFISGGITTSLALLAIAGIAFVVSEIRNFFK
ncbi:MAG: hypothetical protein DHS20C18_29840 [Saprospiraceae bacterium]|nr:MAG: hypothetical protein DHS20C18_29840 [Saprospiraceae bacterium]